MTEAHHKSSTPPRKQRDPDLTARSKDELQRRQEEYIRETMRASALESLRQGTMQPTSVRIGKEGRIKLHELEERLLVEQKILLNMAFAYGYGEAKQNQILAPQLRQRIDATVLDEESVLFEINESTLDILLRSGVEDAKFIYLNVGIDLLHSRLVRLDMSSLNWQ